jgi:branched-chain amino acid transport system substrate-binding protein
MAFANGQQDSEDAGDTVKIGFIWPLSGGSATIGQQHDDGARMAIDEINANGGIKSLGGMKIRCVVADSETKPDKGSIQTERLILEEDVVAVVGAYNSAVSFPSSEVCQRYETPWINMGAVKNEITERGYEWIFRINNKATYDTMEMVKALEIFEAEKGIEIKTIGHIYESTDWGSDAAATLNVEAAKRGWNNVLDEPVTPGQADMNPQILKARSASPDVLFCSLYTPDQIVFQKAFSANKIHPPLGLFSVGGGTQDATFYDAVSKESVEYLFVQDDWDAGGPSRIDWMIELSKMVEERYGYEMNSFFAQGWTAAYIAYLAVEAAGSTDKEAIRKALVDLDVQAPSRALLTGYSRVKFDADGQNTFSHGSITQRQNNTPVVLWPEENKNPSAAVVWPIPNWDER